MAKYFWQYIEWYKKTQIIKNKNFIVVPKDDNWEQMHLNNLKFTDEKEYNLRWTKKAILTQLLPFLQNKSDIELANIMSSSTIHVNKIRNELKRKGKVWNEVLNKLIISHKTYPIYVALLESKWLKSNLELAKEIRHITKFKDKNTQRIFVDRVVRVRKKLYNKWLIEKYNTYQQDINIADVKEDLTQILLKNSKKAKNQKKTHLEIAKIFWLKKEQVDNFSRQIKKIILTWV